MGFELFLLFLFLFLWGIAIFQLRVGGPVQLRPIPAFEFLRKFLGQSIESGRPVHISMGTQGISQRAAAETMAGLTVLSYLAQQGKLYGMPVRATVADPTLLMAAYDLQRRAGFSPVENARFIAPDKTAYAAGAAEVLKEEDFTLNVMIGPFGYEYLLLSEMANNEGIPQVGGTTDPRVLPFVYTSSPHALIGEEIFAAGAYLASLRSHLASLLAQDRVRTLLVVLIIAGAIMKSLGMF